MLRAAAIATMTWRSLTRGRLFYLVVTQPLVFCFVWGYCAAADLRALPTAVFDGAGTAASRELVRRLEASGSFQVVARPADLTALTGSLVTGAASAGLVIPPRYSGAPARDGGAALQLIVDGSDPAAATLGRDHGSRALAEPALAKDAPGLRSSLRILHNPGLRSAAALLLAAICYNAMWFLMYSAQSILRMIETGSMLSLRVSPLNAVELWAGTTLPLLAVALWGMLLQLGIAIVFCGVPWPAEGGQLLLGLAVVVLIHLNVGFCIPLVSRRPAHRTLLGLLFAVLSMAFSGFLVTRAALPGWAQAVSEAVPMTHALEFVRASVLKGLAAPDLARTLGLLLTFAAVSTAFALFTLHRLLEER
jgi:ABC-2 type transport system permease protein